MDTAIAVAVISGVCAAISSLCGILIANRLTTYRIGKLEEKVDKHNHMIERTYKLEQRVETIEHDVNGLGGKVGNLANVVSSLDKTFGVLSEQMKGANHRINDIEVNLHEDL